MFAAERVLNHHLQAQIEAMTIELDDIKRVGG